VTSLPFFQVDAFADRPLTGNPAAVMPLDKWLDEAVMQAIAAENNLAETAFTVPSESEDADYDLRWFTPAVEVPLCGHATLAAGHILIHSDRVRFSTKSGILTVTKRGDLLELNLPAAKPEQSDEPELCAALGLSPRPVWLTAPEFNDSAIVPVENEAEVRAVSPDFSKLKHIRRMAIVTAPGDEQDIASRVFVPYAGIDEDPVTGSAHCCLGPFWAGRLGRTSLTGYQALRRGGTVKVRVTLAGASTSVTVKVPRVLALRARDRALELVLAHLRAALDVQPARLRLELLARRRVAAAHRLRLLAERRVSALRKVLQSLLLLRARLGLLDVLARRGALLLARHSGSPSFLSVLGACRTTGSLVLFT